MEIVDALGVLGLTSPCSWDDVRSAYREQLLASHPDTAAQAADGDRTAAVVAAFRHLRTVTHDGLLAVPVDGLQSVDTGPMVLYAPPGDVFVRLCQAADQVGHLSYVDSDSKVLQLIIAADESGEWATSQLTAELTATDGVTTALFSLDVLGTGNAPPITTVVRRLAELLRAPAALD